MLKNLYAMELYKLWKNKRFLLFLFLLLLCNIGFLSYETWGQQGAETTAYQKLSTHLQTLSSDERFTYLQGHAHDVELAFVREQIRNLKTQHDPQAEMRIAALRDQYPELDQNGTIPSLYTGDPEAENAFLQPIIKQADTVKRFGADGRGLPLKPQRDAFGVRKKFELRHRFSIKRSDTTPWTFRRAR